jgi:hypothetical protein
VQTQPPPAMIVTVIEDSSQQPNVAEQVIGVIVGSFGLAGALTLLSLVLGAAVGGGLVLWHRRHRPESDHLPSVSPFAPDSTRL